MDDLLHSVKNFLHCKHCKLSALCKCTENMPLLGHKVLVIQFSVCDNFIQLTREYRLLSE